MTKVSASIICNECGYDVLMCECGNALDRLWASLESPEARRNKMMRDILVERIMLLSEKKHQFYPLFN
jgi:hypothetical protein